MIRVQREAFDAGAEIAAATEGNPRIGGVCSFIGLVREMNDGAGVSAMTLEHYPGMTEKMLTRVAEQARERWPLEAVRIVHRYGRMEPTEPIVLVVTASPHRHAAFEACQFLMDWLKTQAPFWKREETPDGPRWVDARRSDDEAAARWLMPESGSGT
ncbi:molybdopterin synthase subunit MoaE [Limimonas halophila]|uniref:Molybdopterin synthase catalytic subunit n=1 Tax=Limimonas halophila TaxID=1082479 RepID=A0A1G7LTG8_9PROT|nr:molybdenum cofactor biosynthesis protein MoaE [Limimonas halophila]SDF52676.1 molybdopterin synthase subunit MoaE [Limimonas halophila]